MKMLLMTEALLLVLAALQDHTADADGKILMDMALKSVDDQYDGCTNDMEKLAMKTYLEKELKMSQKYADAWEEGKKKYKDNNLIAIYVYTTNAVYEQFNDEVRGGKFAYMSRKYNWYSLNFFLTKAIQSLNKMKCYDTFRGTKATFQARVGKAVRFESFTSSSLDKSVAQGFGRKSCFEIHTCEGADIHKYSRFPYEKEVLIPPYEVFKVTAVKQNLWCEIVITLKNSGKRSDLNCALTSGKGKP